jgi:photosystem II stability/assembly factor-like uncharacterized protein
MKHLIILLFISGILLPQTGWQAVSHGYSGHFTDVHFVSSTTGYAVSSDLSNQMIKTTDGGASWFTVATSSYSPSYIDFYNSSSGYASTGGTWGYYTVDGGSTWYIKYSSSYPYDCSMSSAFNVILVGSSGSIRRSTDQGSSYTSVYTGNTYDLNSVFFYSENYGWTCGKGAAAYYTTDGGVNWTVNYVTATAPALHYMQSVYFISQTTGWCVGGYSGNYSPIFKTTDGGVNWVKQNHTLTVNQLNAVFFLNANTGWAVGDGGVILYTTNGGTNWTAQTSGTTNNLREVFFVNSTTGIIVGDFSTILRTVDAGLPVELTSFTSAISKNQVTLKWKTATEVNNYGFDIERSETNTPAAIWLKTGFVEGNGNSNSEKEYQFTDTPEKPGKYYYRLKQLDTDGQFEYSMVVEAEIVNPAAIRLLNNYPNPFNPATTISYELAERSFIVLDIYNQLGETVSMVNFGEQEAGYHKTEFSGVNLPGGIYYCRLRGGNKEQVIKMLLLK